VAAVILQRIATRVISRAKPSVAWVLALGLLAAPCAFAHKPSDSYLTLTAKDDQVSVRWDVALRDLDPELGLDVNDDGALSWGEVRSRAEDIAAFVMPQLIVSAKAGHCTAAAVPIALSTASAQAPQLPNLGSEDPFISVSEGVDLSLATHSDGTYAVLQYQLKCPTLSDTLTVDYQLFAASDPTHRGIVRVISQSSASHPRPAGSIAVLGPGNSNHVFSLTAPSRMSTLLGFIVEGIWHIWLGFDHVLFLLTLLLPSVLIGGKSRVSNRMSFGITVVDVLKIVTAFTVAHSLTLTLAVLDWVSLPSRLVESGIALTVFLGALNNLVPVLRERRWMAAFAFGLIHGFGFAGALKSLQLPAGELAISLFGFNVGVEIGQLAIVTAFVPLAFAIRNTRFYRQAIVRGGSILIALIAAAWFIERAWDVKLMTP
jgi:HupE / UreJ protein